MQRVIILGASGMLGSMITDVLSRRSHLQIIATARSVEFIQKTSPRAGEVEWRLFEIGSEAETKQQLQQLGPADWFINAIGLTKPYTHDDNPAEIENAIRGNALFPHWLAQTAAKVGGRVLQIATDCVFSGATGNYVENSKHDALDVYGKTKSLGEALLPNLHHLRCSIVGPEPKAYVFLLEWLRRQPPQAQLNGFTNHCWNGVTTYHFAKLCLGIIEAELPLPQLQHVIPTSQISKHELLRCFAHAFNRTDLMIEPVEAGVLINRTLATQNQPLNLDLWRNAGYPERPPSVPEMVNELAAFDYRFANLSV